MHGLAGSVGRARAYRICTRRYNYNFDNDNSGRFRDSIIIVSIVNGLSDSEVISNKLHLSSNFSETLNTHS